MGIEPTYLAWKASVLPLNYTRIQIAATQKIEIYLFATTVFILHIKFTFVNTFIKKFLFKILFYLHAPIK